MKNYFVNLLYDCITLYIYAVVEPFCLIMYPEI